jgi:hypothetical protein
LRRRATLPLPLTLTIMELTQEYFDQQLNTLNQRIDRFNQRMDSFATKEDLKEVATKEDLKPLATKQDVREGVEELARIIAETVANPMEQHFTELKDYAQVREEVKNLKTDMLKIKQALNIN